MAYNKKTVITSKADAEEVLHNGFAYDDTIYGMAVDFLQQNFPESKALSQLARDEDGYVDMRVSQYNAAKMYETRVQASGGVVDEDLSAAANRYIQEFEARSDMAEDGAAIDINEDIDPISADDSFDELLGSLQEFEQDDAWRDVVKDVLDRTEFYYTSEDEEGKDFAKTIWETVKTKILVNRTLNSEWQAVMRKGGAEKEEWLQEEIKNVYTAEVVTQAGASKIKKPNKKQQVLGSQEHADYIADVAKKSQETFDRYVRKNKKLEISSTMVVAGAGNAWAKLKGFIDFSEAKQLGKNFIGKVKGYRDSFDDKMQQRHPKLWGWAKNIAESAKASKWQTITGLAATGAVIVTGAGAGMLTAYAAYMGVSSWIWPIANKKALELNRAKKTGDESTIAAWKGEEGWERAITSIFTNKRETKNYILKGTIGTVFAGAAGYLANNTELAAGLFGNSEAMNKASDVTKGMIIRTQQAIIRSVGAVTGQFSTWLGDGISYLRDKTEENKAYFKQSSIGLGLAGLLAGGATWWQLHNLHGLENTAVAEAQNTPVVEKDAPAQESVNNNAAQQAAEETVDPNVKLEAEAMAYFERFFAKDKDGNIVIPTEYAENLGIKKSEWKFIQSRLVGWLQDSDNAAHVGTTAADHDVVYDNAVRNVATYMYQHKDQFPEDLSPLKIVHDVLRRHYFSVGNIHADGDGHLIAEKIDGAWAYGDPSLNNNMNAWLEIFCNGSTKRENLDLMAPFTKLDEQLDAARVNGNNNAGIGFRDCDQNERTVFIRGKKIKVRVPDAPAEQPTGTDEPMAPEVVQIEQPTGMTEGAKEFIQQKKQVLYVKTTTNITDGHYGQTSEYNKDGGVVKFVAGKSNDGM